MKRFYYIARTLTLFLLLFTVILVDAQTVVTFGTGTSSSATRGPFQRSSSSSSSVFSRANIVYTAAELSAAGIPTGANITQINWDLGSTNIITASGDATMEVYMKNSAATAAMGDTWTNLISGSTLVGNYTFNTTNNFPGVEGWLSFPITPFTYTGGALEIAVNWDCSNLVPADPGQPNLLFSGNGSLNWHWQSTGHVSLANRAGSSGPPSNITTTKSERANMQIVYTAPIVGPPGTSLFLEDFDGSNTTNPPNISEICSDDRDYFDIVCQNGGGCANEINSDFNFNNVSGNYFGVRDMDADPCSGSLTKTLSFSGIDVSSCSGVSYICIDIAESRNMGGAAGAEWASSNNREDTWDSNSNVTIKASVDGDPFSTVTAIEAFENSDTRPGIDLNCNGKANDSGEPELTDSFTKYCFELPTSGNSLDLEFEVTGLNTQGEDFAMDNIEIFCGNPTAGTVLAACTPFISSDILFFENFDGSNPGNPFTFPSNCDPTASRDYLGVVCMDGFGCTNEINDDYIYSGAEGQFFGVRDMDGNTDIINDPSACVGSLNETISATGIDISSCFGADRLFLCFDMAESAPNSGREMSGSSEDTWDGNQSNPDLNTFVTFLGTVDGGQPFPIASFAAIGNNNSGPGVDTNCDGTGDGAELSDAFQTFCFEIAFPGNTLDLDINVAGMNTDGDDVAIDNITVFCSDTEADLPVPLSVSCTAPANVAIPTMGEWGLFLLALILLTIGSVAVTQQELASANGVPFKLSVQDFPFDKSVFTYWMKRVALFLVGCFAIAIGFFGYELTNADIPGIILTIPVAAYFLHFVLGKKE